MLNPWLNNESLITNTSSMKHLYLGDFPSLLTLPRWILGSANTLLSLVIKNFPNLITLPDCLTIMTRLKRLHIVDCPQLLSLPSDMHRLVVLEDLSIDGCPELCRKCQPRFGEYCPMISHVKHVFIGDWRTNRRGELKSSSFVLSLVYKLIVKMKLFWYILFFIPVHIAKLFYCLWDGGLRDFEIESRWITSCHIDKTSERYKKWMAQ
jgi:hypothetical protein